VRCGVRPMSSKRLPPLGVDDLMYSTASNFVISVKFDCNWVAPTPAIRSCNGIANCCKMQSVEVIDNVGTEQSLTKSGPLLLCQSVTAVVAQPPVFVNSIKRKGLGVVTKGLGLVLSVAAL
jgi:hypothetical protein